MTTQEKSFIRKFITSLSEEEMLDGSAILVKNDYLYRFNFAPTWESHEDNIKTGGDGFEIVSKKHTSKITKEEINKIKIKYGSRYPRSVNRLLDSYASKNGGHNSNNKFTQDKKPDGGDALLDKGQPREETQEDGDNRRSHSHRGRDNRLGDRFIPPTLKNIERINSYLTTKTNSGQNLSQVGISESTWNSLTQQEQETIKKCN